MPLSLSYYAGHKHQNKAKMKSYEFQNSNEAVDKWLFPTVKKKTLHFLPSHLQPLHAAAI